MLVVPTHEVRKIYARSQSECIVTRDVNDHVVDQNLVTEFSWENDRLTGYVTDHAPPILQGA